MSVFSGSTHTFYKMQGSGNDFIVFDNRDHGIAREVMATWAKTLCPRAFCIGADGVIFLEQGDEPNTTRWHFYNADGSRAGMCGNGSRCAATLAFRLGMAPAEHTLLTDVGPIQAHVFPDKNEAQVQLTPVRDMRLNIPLSIDGAKWTAHFANTGVPHTVILAKDARALDVLSLGAKIRYHEQFAPEGTNANFAQVVDRAHIRLRTYERGVENETYACGTGSAATVAILHALGLCDANAQVVSSGGEILEITIRGNDIFLRGKAKIIYQGEMCPAELGL